MKLTNLIFSMLISINVMAAPFIINEASLIKLAKDTASPGLRGVDIELLNAQKAKNDALDNLAPILYTFASQAQTKEQGLTAFVPVFTPTKTYGIGFKKNSSFGISYDLSFNGDHRSASSLNLDNASTAKINLDLKIDLWNDFLGSKTKSLLNVGDLNSKRAKLKNDLDRKKYFINIRRAYWQIIAIKESLKITERLYSLAQLQVKDIKKRRRNSIADKATVALFQSQLVSRSAQRNQLKYNYEMTLRRLKAAIPALNSKQIEFDNYDIETTVGKVLQCTSMISSYDSAPKQYTSVDEMVTLLKDIQQNELKVAKKHSNIDLFMEANIRNTGVDSSTSSTGTLSNAIDDFRDNDRKGYQVGFYLNIPIGSQKKTTREIKEKLVKNRYVSLMESLSSNLDSTHVQIKSTISLLVGLIKDQKENTVHLNTRLKEMNKKYKQARINYTDFIGDQNNYHASELAVVETELMILNTIFDYLEVFTELPCNLNI